MPRAKTKPAQRKKPQRRLLDKKRAFLAAFAICGEIEASARTVGIDKSAHYDWLKKDPKYPKRFADAKLQADDCLEDEATHRARVGVFEPNVYQGRFVYPPDAYEDYEFAPAVGVPGEEGFQPADVRQRLKPDAVPLGVYKKSDFLLGLRLRAAKPEYRANALEITGKGGGAIESQHRIVFVKAGETPAK